MWKLVLILKQFSMNKKGTCMGHTQVSVEAAVESVLVRHLFTGKVHREKSILTYPQGFQAFSKSLQLVGDVQVWPSMTWGLCYHSCLKANRLCDSPFNFCRIPVLFFFAMILNLDDTAAHNLISNSNSSHCMMLNPGKSSQNLDPHLPGNSQFLAF